MKQKFNNSYWDNLAFIYDFFHTTEKKSYLEVSRKIIKSIKENDTILELACGTGIFSELINKNCSFPINYIATDISPKMIDVCHSKNIPNIKFEMADATNLQFADNTFNCVIIANALHHINKPEKTFSEIDRVLKDDGLLFAPNFLASSTFIEQIALYTAKYLGRKNVNDFDLEGYLSLFENNGFNIIEHDTHMRLRKMAYVFCKKAK